MSFVEDLFSLKGQTAVVIGGTGVLCGEMATGLAKAGAKVVIVGRSGEKGLSGSQRSRPLEVRRFLWLLTLLRGSR